ncbi:thermoresistant glucokinase family carbohydrate kinase protein [Rutstroemia sp. NJR-2017a WRK4]|nr:thermoresistant glucokinase family carbohydrate kinase protein [Rutstroemia sp. NJR-2017a WRK4]
MLSYENRSTLGQPTPATADHIPISTSSNSLSNKSSARQSPSKHHHIWLITGPAGCGKSTVAQYVAKAMNLPFIEGDEFHPKSNVEKMSKGIPLTDADRWDWLTALREESLRRLTSGSDGVVLTCSALKRKYRDVIRVAPYYDRDVLRGSSFEASTRKTWTLHGRKYVWTLANPRRQLKRTLWPRSTK